MIPDILPIDKAVQVFTLEPIAYPVIVLSVCCFFLVILRGLR